MRDKQESLPNFYSTRKGTVVIRKDELDSFISFFHARMLVIMSKKVTVLETNKFFFKSVLFCYLRNKLHELKLNYFKSSSTNACRTKSSFISFKHLVP